MKVTTEKLPKSLVALDIELDRDQVEKGLDRAARRLSQKYNVPGFRKGKAPRFILENYLGRDAILEEATDDLINKAFQEALKQENLSPIGPASLVNVNREGNFSFRVTIPVSPTVTLGDYRSIRVEMTPSEVTDETVERAMDVLRDKHVVLQELDEPRAAQAGDRLTVKMDSIIDGKSLEQGDEDGEDEDSEEQELPESPLDLEQGRIVDELFNALVGANVGDNIEVTAVMPEDHANEDVRGKEVLFKVEIVGMQQRLLPDWEELPTLENFEGSLDDLRAKTRKDLEDSARTVAERDTIETYIKQLIEQTDYDLPDVMVHNLAHDMLHEQGQQYERYGITLDQMLQYRGKTHDEAVEELLPDAERQTKSTLALQQLVLAERITLTNEEIDAEAERLSLDYPEAEREVILRRLKTEFRSQVANTVLDGKLRERLVAIATGNAPELPAAPSAEAAEEAVAAAETADATE